MSNQEKFARFKNRLLSPSFLNDGPFFAQILGRGDFIFWDHIQEKAPYVPIVKRISDIVKGQIILERMEIEPSPKRMADLLQGVYDTLSFYSITPEGENDGMWQRYAGSLQGLVDSIGLDGLRVEWAKQPEVCYTEPPLSERYYLPGELSVAYTGKNWNEAESKKIIETGFISKVLKDVHDLKTNEPVKPLKREWWNTSWVQAVGLISAVLGILGFLLFHN